MNFFKREIKAMLLMLSRRDRNVEVMKATKVIAVGHLPLTAKLK
jgi:hypothetical protein